MLYNIFKGIKSPVLEEIIIKVAYKNDVKPDYVYKIYKHIIDKTTNIITNKFVKEEYKDIEAVKIPFIGKFKFNLKKFEEYGKPKGLSIEPKEGVEGESKSQFRFLGFKTIR